MALVETAQSKREKKKDFHLFTMCISLLLAFVTLFRAYVILGGMI